jgi:hypothetical protein
MRCTLTITLLLLATCLTGLSNASTLNVPQVYATIQEALDDAGYGDQVLVAPGHYNENILWPRQNGIRLSGSGAEQTIIDGQGIDRTIHFPHADFYTWDTTIEGFTITGGDATGALKWGGGIYLPYVQSTIQDCIIMGNSASRGAGIFSAGHATLRRLVIWDNDASYRGGGILIAGDANLVDHCSIAFNRSESGPAVWFSSVSETMFSNNIIYGNVGDSPGSQMIIDDPYPFAGPLYIEYNDLTSIPLENPPVILGLGNITLPPRFVDYQNGDLRLEMFSPCIDAGNPTDPLDPDGTRSDIGAIPYDTNVPAGVADTPLAVQLRGNYPNPFNPRTTIRFTLDDARSVQVTVFTADGRRVATLAGGGFGAGAHEVVWDGLDHAGRPQPSGSYMYVVQADDVRRIGRMTLVR